MTTEQTPPGRDTTREADARAEVDQFRAEIAQRKQPVRYRDIRTGRHVHAHQVGRIRVAGEGIKPFSPPILTEQEQMAAARALSAALEQNAVKYPKLAQTLINSPENIWMLGEIQMMLGGPREDLTEVSYEFTGELMDALTNDEGAIAKYEYETSHGQTQQLFWNDYGRTFGPEERAMMISALAQVTDRGADRVVARLLAWADDRDMEDEETRAQFLLNLFTYVYAEDQYEMGMTQGLFGLLDAPQQWVEDELMRPAINWGMSLLSGAEEAARREWLTPGQQAAYMLGVRPPDDPGEWGWWKVISGFIDAQQEIGLDPLNALAGVGLAGKSVKTLPLAAKATKAGRAAVALRALLPRSLSGATRQVGGGRAARITYAFRAKTVDELMEQSLKNGVAEQMLKIIKSNDPNAFRRAFPGWDGIPDEAWRTIQEAVETPREMLEVIKGSALNDFINSGVNLVDAQKRLLNARNAAAQHVQPGQVGARRLAENIAQSPDKYVYHASDATDLKSITAGGLHRSREAAEQFVRHGDAASSKTVYVMRLDDLPPSLRGPLERSGQIGNIRGAPPVRPIAQYNPAEGLNTIRMAGQAEDTATAGARAIESAFGGQKVHPALSGLDDIGRRLDLEQVLTDPNVPRSIKMELAFAEMAVNKINGTAGRPFVITNVPHKPKVFSWNRVLDKVKGTGRLATGVRRVGARMTPGRPGDEISLFKTRDGVRQIDDLLSHFGMRREKINELVNEFAALDVGARQDWVWDRMLRELGREIKVPLLEQQLVQLYKDASIRSFSAAGKDVVVVSGRAHNMPIIPNQYAAKMPIPLDEIRQIANRARSIGNRGKVAKALGWNGRGLGATKSRRVELVQRLKHELGDAAQGMSDEQLFQMAYSSLSPNTGMDGRGWFAAFAAPKAGAAWDVVHNKFKRMMLALRPIQWAWRVAVLEEPMRAHMYNLPSLYTNPLQYMANIREAHYINNARKWAEANSRWGQDLYRTLTKGANKEGLLRRIDEANLRKDIFGKVNPNDLALPQIRERLADFISMATYSRTRVNKLSPIKRVPFAVKNRAKNIDRAEKALDKYRLETGFHFADDAQEISMKLMNTWLGEAIGASDRKLYQFVRGGSQSEAFTHGRVWGGNIVQMIEDSYGKIGLQRLANRMRGMTPDDADIHRMINSSQFDVMRHDLRLRFPDAADDFDLARRYLDEVLGPELEHLFEPFLRGLSPVEFADMMDDFIRTRRISTRLGDQVIDWNLSDANYGAGVRQVGDYVAGIRHDPTAVVPSNLPAVSFDPRFLAADDKGYVRRMSDWILQTFGEDATQVMNRRPAWLREHRRWFDNYTALGVPEDMARRMAADNANQMVNYVFFNMDEAPYYAAKLNEYIPFFGATYEVLSTWTYKLPVGVGGSWPLGVGEFARKFQRIMDAFTNIGLITREEQDDGSILHTLNLVPPDSSAASHDEMGRMLQGAGFAIVRTLEETIATILNMEEGLGIRSGGLRMTLGHPLNPQDFGVLSFATADAGLNPVVNFAVTRLAASYGNAGGPKRDVARPGETLADLSDRLDMDVNDIVRYNREVFVDTEAFGSTQFYNDILTGQVDPMEIVLPERTVINIPGSSLFDAFEDVFMKFGSVDSPHELAVTFLPGVMRWALMAIALQNQPTDEFWKSAELGGIFGGALPPLNKTQLASQVSESFMYLEAHDTINGKGPFARIQEKTERMNELLAKGKTEEANALKIEIDLDTEAFLSRVQKGAVESLLQRTMSGQLMPASPGHVRLEQEIIQRFWSSRDYADELRMGGTDMKLSNFKSMEEVEQFFGLVAAWLEDPTGDRARAAFYQTHPNLMAYLTPKTFYAEPIPELQSYEEFVDQVKRGEREPAPLHVSMWRARSSAIQADYYNTFISRYGNDPLQAAANALHDREGYRELQEERQGAYHGLEMWDDMHGGVYNAWRQENYQDVETWAEDQIMDKLNEVRDGLSMLFEIEDAIEIDLDLEGIRNLSSSMRAAIAKITVGIREYRDLTKDPIKRNAYEEAIHRYFEEVYLPYTEEISRLYDRLPEVADSERRALIYEQIKLFKNEHAGSTVFMDDRFDVPFPNPLDYSWEGRSEEERETRLQQWATRPLEWIDQDQAIRLVEMNPNLSPYLPTDDADFDIYREFTLTKIEIDEAFEANEIKRGERNKAIANLNEQLRERLILSGRGKEVEYMDMVPFEKLELAGLLPEQLGILSESVRWYNQVLNDADISAGTIQGRHVVAPLLDWIEEQFYTDPTMRQVIQTLGINLRDDDTLDRFLPWFLFGYWGER